MDLEGILIKTDDNDANPPEPEEDFGDGGGGCEHPECAVEHIIAHSVESIAECIAAFDYAGWELSDRIRELLKEFGEALAETFEEVEAEKEAKGIIIGKPYFAPPESKH